MRARSLPGLSAIVVGCTLLAAASCVPADEALPLGSAEFTVTGRGSPRTLTAEMVVDQWSIHVDRFLISFRTMTIVNLMKSDQCAYRGRGAQTNVVFDGTTGSLVQAFNGLPAGDCPDVGMRLGPPDDFTVPGEGATAADLVNLAGGLPAHALLEATATKTAQAADTGQDQTLHLSLRFDTARTASAFGGCRDAIRGARIHPLERDAIFVDLAVETFFRDAISMSAHLKLEPFLLADRQGNDDGTVTMDELDGLPLASVNGPFYELPTGSRSGTFGDYVRAQFMFAVRFGNGGLCDGLAPGTPDQ